jgi:hypothetical protein
MIELLKGIFSENSPYSMMRVLSLICVFSGCILAFTKGDPVVVGLLLGSGISGKAIQKIKEG